MKLRKRGQDEPSAESYDTPDDTYARLKGKLRIDKHELDSEAVEQPVLYQEVSEAHAEAIAYRDTLKEALQAKDAELAEEYRTKAANTGERTSETKIGDLVSQDPHHKKAHALWVKAAKQAALLSGLLGAVDQRHRVLRDLANLYVAGYFDRVSASSAKRGADEGRAAAGREGMRNQRNALRARSSE